MNDFPLGNDRCSGCRLMATMFKKYGHKWYCRRCYINILETDNAALRKERDELAKELKSLIQFLSINNATITRLYGHINRANKILKELENE